MIDLAAAEWAYFGLPVLDMAVEPSAIVPRLPSPAGVVDIISPQRNASIGSRVLRQAPRLGFMEADEPVYATIAGYYCLSAGSVRREAAPEKTAKRAPEPIPVVRMGRFAIDRAYQGGGWGAELLREALLSTVRGAEAIGARAMLVDAIDDGAAEFYRRFGFRDSPIHPLQLFKDLREIRASAGLD